MSDLPNCPFCGSENVAAFRHVARQPEPCVMCNDCLCSAVSVTKWKARATPLDNPRVAALLDVVQEITDVTCRGHHSVSGDWFVSRRLMTKAQEALDAIRDGVPT